MGFLRTLFSKTGLAIMIYLVIGMFAGPPGGAGFPPTTLTGPAIVDWLRWGIWVILWPIGLIFHHPAFTL